MTQEILQYGICTANLKLLHGRARRSSRVVRSLASNGCDRKTWTWRT